MINLYYLIILLLVPMFGTAQVYWQAHFDDETFKVQTIKSVSDEGGYNLIGIKQGQPFSMALNSRHELFDINIFAATLPYQSDVIFTQNEKIFYTIEHQNDEVNLAAINMFGRVIWTKELDIDATINSVILTQQKSFLIGGMKERNMYVAHIDIDGTVIWEQTFGGIGKDEILDVQELSDGNFLVSGYTDMFNSGETDMLIIKLDNDGKNIWEKALGDSDKYEKAYLTQETSNGELIIIGQSDDDLWLIQLNEEQNVKCQDFIKGEDKTFLPTALSESINDRVIISAQYINEVDETTGLYLLEYQFVK